MQAMLNEIRRDAADTAGYTGQSTIGTRVLDAMGSRAARRVRAR